MTAFLIPTWRVTWQPLSDYYRDCTVRVSQNDLDALLRVLVFNGVAKITVAIEDSPGGQA